MSVRDGLLRVGTWAAEVGPMMATHEGPVEFLGCADGIFAGASGQARTLRASIRASTPMSDISTLIRWRPRLPRRHPFSRLGGTSRTIRGTTCAGAARKVTVAREGEDPGVSENDSLHLTCLGSA